MPSISGLSPCLWPACGAAEVAAAAVEECGGFGGVAAFGAFAGVELTCGIGCTRPILGEEVAS